MRPWHGLRCASRGALLLAVVVAGLPALVAVQYRATAGSLDAAALQALAQSAAVRTLFGQPVALDDPGGFTVWRTGTPLGVAVAVWAVLAATRTTRGEEEAGRWALLLSGRLSPAAVLRRHLEVLGGICLALGAVAALALVAAGTSPSGAVLHGASLALLGGCCAALGLWPRSSPASARRRPGWRSACWARGCCSRRRPTASPRWHRCAC